MDPAFDGLRDPATEPASDGLRDPATDAGLDAPGIDGALDAICSFKGTCS